MKVSVALVDSLHGSLICVETSETERWHNRKMKRTAEKKFVIIFWNFAKNKNLRRADCSGP